MYKIIVICLVISLSVAAPTFEEAQAKILNYSNDIDGNGNYEFSFETSNGISRKESGRLVNVGQPDEHIEVQGEYSYPDAEGKLVVFRYTADENGYHVGEGGLEITLPPPVVAALPPAAVATLLGG